MRIWARIVGTAGRLSLAQRFMLASVCILTCGMAGIGWWITEQIDDGVIHETAATTALYMDSMVAQNVQELADQEALTAEHAARLNDLLRDTPLGHRVVALKVWDAAGRVVFSTDPSTIGQTFPMRERLIRAWRGEVPAEISRLKDAENVSERGRWPELLEVYSPIRVNGTDRIIAVAEFYQTMDQLDAEIRATQRRTWLVVSSVTAVMYLLLGGFVQRASDTIARQQVALKQHVAQLTDLLRQNRSLRRRVQGAAARTAALNERFLRRVSAELHDGPAQDLALALLRLDRVAMRCAACLRGQSPRVLPEPGGQDKPESGVESELELIVSSLQHALREVRAISAGLTLPQLTGLTLGETLLRAVRSHEQRTGTRVALDLGDLPAQAGAPVKITLYRVAQEALNNAYRHARGAGQRVRLRADTGGLLLEVFDQGPGFDVSQAAAQDERLGLAGMRERVESLGGLFAVYSEVGRGTTIAAHIPLQTGDTFDVLGGEERLEGGGRDDGGPGEPERPWRYHPGGDRGRSPAVPAGSGADAGR